MTTLRVNASETIDNLAEMRAGVVAAVELALKLLAAHAAAHARATTTFKDRTGRLRNSVRTGHPSKWTTFVKVGGDRAPYAQFIENGSKAHEIVARNARVLRYVQNGQVFFRRRVWHPGTRPTRFMQSARDATEDLALKYLEPGLNSVLSY